MELLSAGINSNLTSGAYLVPISVAVVVLAYVVVSSVLAHRRLRHFNGPFSASFSHYWLARASYSGRMGEEWAAADAQYGTGTGLSSTIRIGPNELLTSDPDVIRRTSAARSHYTRSAWYKTVGVDPYHDSMFSTLDTAAHDRLKAQTAPGYAGRDHPRLEAEVDRIVALMVDKIRGKYAVGTKKKERPLLDLASMAQYFTLDSISKIAFGDEFGLIREERDIHGHMEIVNEIAAPAVTIAVVPVLCAIMGSKVVLKLIGPKPGDKKGVGRMLKIGRDVVAKRFGPDAKDQDDMLVTDLPWRQGSFIRHGLTQPECQTEAIIQILAGSDTTATAIRATMLYLMSTPRAYHTLQAEIDHGIRAGKVSSPVTNAEANELPYLQAVILEGLRIHPPFTGLPFKVVPPGGDTIDGRPVPAGTLIAPNHVAVGRLRAVFGADADIFRPERWLDAAGRDREKKAEMRRVAELAFGYGRWGCAGKMIAFLELKKVFVELLRRFDFQLANPARPWKSANYNLYLQSDMWVSVSLRNVEKL
ncbi:cytochrome P450 monooxygenase [Parathielavia hyrcaniae]|uniref:Cytochrome P450 monooxygenase ABA1 n=1 Tax=Parathielavia hyrcaniae TaxID=113614 RepID=A0AAN6T2E8_9PEZI|nr:cytochrome P450 monooxygenase [Parathielavia hyrcaniae]